MTLTWSPRTTGTLPRLPVLRRAASIGFLGPAFVAGIAYVDPGNVATNFAAGSRFGYRLLWVVVVANLIAALMQSLAAKLGLATGRNLAQISRARYSRPVGRALWLQAEVVAIATDLAEVVGGAIALQILFGLPLPLGAVATAAAACGVLALRRRGCRPFELAISAFFLVIVAGFVYDLVAAAPAAADLPAGLVPGFSGADSVVLATAVVGATVMPHALYVHSALTQRQPGSRLPLRRALRLQRIDIGVAMGAAGLVNAAMVVIAAAALPGVTGGIGDYHGALVRTLGAAAGFAFVVALLASGLASSGVGTFAGEVVMAGFLERRIPRVARRLITLAPSVVLLSCGVPATTALIASQVVLGLGVPIALTTLIAATRDRGLMGALVNRRSTTVIASACAAAVAAIDVYALTRL